MGFGMGFGIGMGLWQMGWDDGIWDGIWDGMGVGILPFPLIWVASINISCHTNYVILIDCYVFYLFFKLTFLFCNYFFFFAYT